MELVLNEAEHRSAELIEREFSADEIKDGIKWLANGKACGQEGIYNEFPKQATELAPQLSTLFTACLQQGEIPSAWRSDVMILIPKGKGPSREPASWQGICKKSCVYKLLSSRSVRKLTPFPELTESLPEEQHGFRAGKSTMTACGMLLDEIADALSRPGRPLNALFVDFKAASDTAPRDLLVEKLTALAVPRRMLQLLTAML